MGKGTRKKWPVFVVFYYEGGEGRRKCKILRNFFISHAFVGVFQNYPGPLKHASELRDYVKYMFSFLAIFFVPFPNSLSINLKWITLYDKTWAVRRDKGSKTCKIASIGDIGLCADCGVVARRARFSFQQQTKTTNNHLCHHFDGKIPKALG